jgi:glutaredoxin 3
MSSAKPWRYLTVAKLELYGTANCPYTQELRESLEWSRRDFLEYDIEADPEARKRLRSLDCNLSTVPVLVEDGKVVQVGWQGRGCVVGWGS